MKNTLYHNPKCSKSRAALELVNEKGLEVEVVEYLKNPPSAEELKLVCEKLRIKPLQLIRTKEEKFKELGLSEDDNKTDEQWYAIMHEYPVLIERPVLVYNGKAAIGRPTENLLAII